MRTTLIFALLLSFSAPAQPEFAIIEYTGTVLSIRPGYQFALETIELKTNDDTYLFNIDPEYGQSVLSKIKTGQSLSVRVRVNLKIGDIYKKLNTPPTLRSDRIIEIKIGEQWISTPKVDSKKTWNPQDTKLFLEKRIQSDYIMDEKRKGLIFDDGVVAFNIYAGYHIFSMEEFNPGSYVSFYGHRQPRNDKYLYPVDGVKEVVSFTALNRVQGKISAFVHKQNFLRMGLVINNWRFSFPGELGKQLEKFANEEPVTIYHDGRTNDRTNLLPTIQALIQGRDTIIISRHYYGDPDGSHQFQSTEIDGKISKVNRSDKGAIISLIIGNDCYVEVDHKMAGQLGQFFSKGKSIKILGDERIKKEGEIYEKNYRIITPRKVVADGKEFILKN